MKEEVKNRIDEKEIVTKDENVDKKDNNKSFERKLKNWKNSVARSGTLSELKKKRFYEKPGVRKRNEKKENIRNSRKNHKNSR